MDIEHIRQLIEDLDISGPAFEDTRFEISELPPMDGVGLGCYFPDENLIVVAPYAEEAVILHEMGHRHADFYYHDLSEEAAESFRRVYQGDYQPWDNSVLSYILATALGIGLGIGLGTLLGGAISRKIR